MCAARTSVVGQRAPLAAANAAGSPTNWRQRSRYPRSPVTRPPPPLPRTARDPQIIWHLGFCALPGVNNRRSDGSRARREWGWHALELRLRTILHFASMDEGESSAPFSTSKYLVPNILLAHGPASVVDDINTSPRHPSGTTTPAPHLSPCNPLRGTITKL